MRTLMALMMVAVAACPLGARAQNYPSRTITIVVPYPAS